MNGAWGNARSPLRVPTTPSRLTDSGLSDLFQHATDSLDWQRRLAFASWLVDESIQSKCLKTLAPVEVVVEILNKLFHGPLTMPKWKTTVTLCNGKLTYSTVLTPVIAWF